MTQPIPSKTNMNTDCDRHHSLDNAYIHLIAQRFQRILDYPLYRDNPIDITLETLLRGCVERQTGCRYTSVSDYFYNSIFQFCTLVSVGESGFDHVLEDNYTLITDSDKGFSSIQLTNSNLITCGDHFIAPWMSTLNGEPIQLLKDTWNKEGQIWFLSYWEKFKRGICDYVNHFHFINNLNLGAIRIEILKTQVFVFTKLLHDPTLIEDDEFISWTCCAPPEMMEHVHELCVSVFNDSFRRTFSDLLESRNKELLSVCRH